MSKPRRIQLRRTKGWRLQEASVALNGLPAVKVDRSTKWGNPHDWRDWRENFPPRLLEWEGAALRDVWCKERAADAFAEDIRTGFLALPVHELRGLNLACWCPAHMRHACHAEVLLEIANACSEPH